MSQAQPQAAGSALLMDMLGTLLLSAPSWFLAQHRAVTRRQQACKLCLCAGTIMGRRGCCKWMLSPLDVLSTLSIGLSLADMLALTTGTTGLPFTTPLPCCHCTPLTSTAPGMVGPNSPDPPAPARPAASVRGPPTAAVGRLLPAAAAPRGFLLTGLKPAAGVDEVREKELLQGSTTAFSSAKQVPRL